LFVVIANPIADILYGALDPHPGRAPRHACTRA
jgi:hypothetical protein